MSGLTLSYEVIGDTGRPWIITPGGRYSKDDPGIRPLAEAIAAAGYRVVIWDRPNCGESDVCFEGGTESGMQADYLAALLRHLDMSPAVLLGGSGGARVSLLAAANHPDVASAMALLWISGGVYGLMTLAGVYCGPSMRAAIVGGMEAVAELPDWQEVISRNPGNRQRILAQDRDTFLATMERWMAAYCPNSSELVPGLSNDEARSFDLPALVFRSGTADMRNAAGKDGRPAGACVTATAGTAMARLVNWFRSHRAHQSRPPFPSHGTVLKGCLRSPRYQQR